MAPRALTPEAIRPLIEDQRLQQWKVAEILGVSVSCVERTCKRLGLQTQKTGNRPGREHTGWKGGCVLVGGYRYVYRPDHPNATKRGYVLEHRLVVEAVLGRLLRRGEVVHHVDGDRLNNSKENLMVFGSNAKHLKHELTGRPDQLSPEGRAKVTEAARQTRSARKQAELDGRARKS